MTPSSGLLRAGYLAVATSLRGALNDTRLLESWTTYALQHPRSALAHARTLLAVHNANDLVRLDLPWWTYRSIDIVEKHLEMREGKARVFEFGSGASTLWLARRSASLTTVEHHPEWADRVRSLVAEAEDLSCEPKVVVAPVPESESPEMSSRAPNHRGLNFSEYVRSIDEVDGTFDLVAIDGRAREHCFRHALSRVGENGLLLFDDAQRRRYRTALAEAEASGWRVLVTKGATPCQPLPRHTALVARSDAVFADLR